MSFVVVSFDVREQLFCLQQLSGERGVAVQDLGNHIVHLCVGFHVACFEGRDRSCNVCDRILQRAAEWLGHHRPTQFRDWVVTFGVGG